MPALVDPLVLVLVLAPSALRALLLAIAWLTALCTSSPGRREVACYLVCLLLTPPWRRGGERELPG